MHLRWLIPVCALLLAACGAEPGDPEARLRATIDAAERAIEARSLKQVAVMVSPEYRDAQGHDRRAINQLLFGYLQRHSNIHLLNHVSELQLSADGKSGEVQLYVAMAGAPIATLQEAASLRADLYRFDLSFVDSDDGWQLRRATWRRAGLDELLP